MKWFWRRREAVESGPAGESAGESAGGSVPRPRVLMVEDDKVVARVYSMALEEAGFEVEVAVDGQKALDRVVDWLPEILLLDLQLPKVDGIEVLRQLRAQPLFKTLPVVVFTNTFLGEQIRKAKVAGANLVLQKARSTPDAVAAALRKCLEAGVTEGPAAEASVVVAPGAAPGVERGTAIPFPEAPQVLASMKEAEHDLWHNVRRQFLEDAPTALTALRLLLHDLAEGADPAARLSVLDDLYARARSMTASASLAGFRNLAVFTSAFEALLKTISETPSQLSLSVVRTLIEAVDCFGMLFRATQPSDAQAPSEVRLLVVDDDAVSAMIMSAALGKVGWKPRVARLPSEALGVLGQEDFDVILLDVVMPEMDGFEVCRRLRELPRHGRTPVIFVTSMNDFTHRVRSAESGAADFIGKPFLHVELAVKVLNHLVRGQAGKREEGGG